jgi:hypothetical protein
LPKKYGVVVDDKIILWFSLNSQKDTTELANQ